MGTLPSVLENGTYDCIVVGDGVAGLSAALYLGRARRPTLVLGAGEPRNAVALKMHGFLSREGITPHELLEIARAQIEAYPDVVFERERIVAAETDGRGFRLRGESGKVFASARLLLATGVRDVLPEIDGIANLWGSRLFTCPYCDGWEFRDRPLAIVGRGCEAISLAREMLRWSKRLTVVATDGTGPAAEDRAWFALHRPPVITSPLARFREATDGVALDFGDGGAIEVAAVFFSAPLRQRSGLPAALGCELDAEGRIVVDDCGRTNVPNCYAAGDAANHRHQVVLAAAGGAAAAMAINEDLIERER